MCLTTPATVVRTVERGGICVVTVLWPGEGERDCITYVDGVQPGERVRVAGGAIIERVADHVDDQQSLTDLLIEAFDQTHANGGGTTS
ncbi:MAG: hypothetical protein AB7N24_14235 [Dehalococcoidia bacterium]